MAELVYRHNRITRLTHWINALALVVLFMSGLQIFNAYPNLHWGDKAEPDEAFFSIDAAQEDGEVKGYTKLYGLHIETTGFLGVQNTPMGPSARAFPSWLTIPGFYSLAAARRWHFFFAWLFILNGLGYVIFNLLNGHMRKFFLTLKDAAGAPAMAAYYLRLRREPPQQEEYNPLQKLAYTGAFFILTPLVLLTGLAMSPQVNVAFNWLPATFGGRQSARSFHFILTFLFAAFTFGHVFMVMTTGLVNNMRSIVTGWYREKLPAPAVLPLTEPEPAEPAPAGEAVEEAQPSEPAKPDQAEGETEKEHAEK